MEGAHWDLKEERKIEIISSFPPMRVTHVASQTPMNATITPALQVY